MQRFLPYGRQSINNDDVAAVSAVLHEEIITRGRHVEAFEQALAQRCEARYAVAFNSGTAALQAAYFAAGLSPHDRVYTTPNSFFATAGAALATGARLIFVDIDLKNGNLSLDQLAANINIPNSRGRDCIVPVHFAGIPVAMEELDRLIKNPDTIVIEDAAHALGSYYSDGSPVGNCQWSAMTIFSFHPVKTITSGEGGAVTTNDENFYHLLRRFRNNGIEREPSHLQTPAPGPWYYEVHAVTGNYNFTDLQAALALSQLGRLDTFADHRRRLVERYYQLLEGRSPHLRLFSKDHFTQTAYHLFVAQIDFAACRTTRQQVVERLYAANIGTQVHYIPIYRHPYMAERMGDICQYFPAMESYYAQALSLPLFYDLQLDEVDQIAHTLLRILR